MSIPEFTAEASLYKTSNRYRSSGTEFGDLTSAQSVVAAYMPGSGTQARCNECLGGCAKGSVTCNLLALGTIWFPPAAAAAFAACFTGALACTGLCTAPVIGTCCPKVCGFPNPFIPGEGCCDNGEQCVDRFDPNARQGCCPSDQNVCGGKCCAKGDTCCGGECCPQNRCCGSECCPDDTDCINGFCIQKSFGMEEPPQPPPSPPYNPLTDLCPLGFLCGDTCCPLGYECCGTPGRCQVSCVS